MSTDFIPCINVSTGARALLPYNALEHMVTTGWQPTVIAVTPPPASCLAPEVPVVDPLIPDGALAPDGNPETPPVDTGPTI